MKFTIARSELLPALYLAQGVVERRTTIPILGNALVESIDPGISISATDQEVAVRSRCCATVTDPGALCVNAKMLHDAVRQLPDGDISVTVGENLWVEVSSGQAKFRLVGMSATEFPSLPDRGTGQIPVLISNAVLTDMFAHVAFAVSDDDMRVNLNGVFFESEGIGRVRAISTDGHRLAVVVRTSSGEQIPKGFILPAKAMGEVKKMIAKGDVDVSVFICEGVIHFECGTASLSARLVQGEFPDFRQVLPNKFTKTAEVDTSLLLSAMRRVAVVSSDRTRGVKLEFGADKLAISAINPNVGEATDEVDISYTGEPLTIGLNAAYIVEMLAMLPDDSRVQVCMNDETSPAVIQQVGDPDYFYVVMPMRL